MFIPINIFCNPALEAFKDQVFNFLRSGDAVYVAEIGPNRLRKFEVIMWNMQKIKCKKIAQKESKYQQEMYEDH